MRDQIVQNDIGPAYGDPATGIVAVSMQEIENWVSFLRVGVISRRRVDVIIALIADHARLVEVVMDDPMWHVVRLPGQRWGPGYVNYALTSVQVRFHQRIARIHQRHTIRYKRITVIVRFK